MPRQQAFELAVGAVAGSHQARCAGGQPLRGTDIGNTLAEVLLQRRDDQIIVGGVARGFLRLSLGERNEAEVHIALAQRTQRLAAEVKRRRGPQRIDVVRQQQHLDTAGRGGLELRVRLQPLQAFTDQIINLGLVRLEVVDILLQRPRLAHRGGEARKPEQLFTPLAVFPDAFLEHRAERIPDFRERLAILLRHAFQLADHTRRDRLADLRQLRIVLQHLAREV